VDSPACSGKNRKEIFLLFTSKVIRGRADSVRIKKTVYPHSLEVAAANGEKDRYRENSDLNTDCVEAIDKAINESQYKQYHYDLKTAVRKVVAQYGEKRVAWVTASTIQQHIHDGRYSSANKEWAKGFDIPSDQGRYCIARSHACLVDYFAEKHGQCFVPVLCATCFLQRFCRPKQHLQFAFRKNIWCEARRMKWF